MPNNVVFNNVASQLKTQIYGSGALPISTDASGNLNVVGTVTAITSAQFTSESDQLVLINATDTSFSKDTSQQKVYTFYLFNTSAATVTAYLEVSPTTAESYFVDDPSTLTVFQGIGRALLVPKIFMQYTRLRLEAGAATVTAEVYYNAQT